MNEWSPNALDTANIPFNLSISTVPYYFYILYLSTYLFGLWSYVNYIVVSPNKNAFESPTLLKYNILLAPSNLINPILAVAPISYELHSYFIISFILI